MHKCCATGCEIPVAEHLLMCGPHWKKVPPEIAREVNVAYAALVDATKRHRRAAIAAVRAVRSLIIPVGEVGK